MRERIQNELITLKEILERDKRPPSVTVSMVSYNHAKYLDEAMHGVLMQKTNFPVNIVVHDDASPDGSAEIIRRYAAENANITAILQPVNLMQNGKSVFLCMLPYLTGKYVAYCECDDFWLDPNKLQIQVDYLEANPDCVAVYSNTLPINKYSEYDESMRVDCFPKTKEGDYPSSYVMHMKHQIASCVMRNLYIHMTPEEIDYYTHVRTNGDEKLFVMFQQLGRVHYFKEEFAAHRQVNDEGDSWTARKLRMSEYEFFKHIARSTSDMYVMIEHFFGKIYTRRYIDVLWEELKGIIKFRKSVIKDAQLNECYHFRNIPLYIWPAFAVYVPYRVVKKIAKTIMPTKVWETIKKLRSRNRIA